MAQRLSIIKCPYKKVIRPFSRAKETVINMALKNGAYMKPSVQKSSQPKEEAPAAVEVKEPVVEMVQTESVPVGGDEFVNVADGKSEEPVKRANKRKGKEEKTND